ncbi:high frequency lysogenization protein HflD [Kitasatospora sp. NPDC096147]|uniref:high frequency lysogenization protein HflD n=1 Tax=Kitasatospora sp. NPDC096147 TaxID=3364093 RepID=UPI003812F2A5
MPRPLARTAAATSGALLLLGLAAPVAQAHPLGNFSVNHYLGFTAHPERLDLLALTDTAEIPTLQEQSRVDANGDGTADETERAAWADAQCARTSAALRVSAGPAVLSWVTDSARFGYQEGAAGLRSSRVECRLHAELPLPDGGVEIRAIAGNDPARVGWHEITARGEGVTVEDSDVPERSVSDELRDYPRDLLDTPSGVTHARFRLRPGGGDGSAARAIAGTVAGSGPAAWLAGLDARLARLGAAQRLTVPLGLLAVLLSLVLGAGHALLPGHGKTVMAAYLAGRHGRTRDAVIVGATVTGTHTAGVLVIGLSLTAFSSLAGDELLGWLGVVSGLLVVAVGVSLLRDAVRRLPRGGHRHDHGHGHHGHEHGHGHGDEHGHGHVGHGAGGSHRELAHAAAVVGHHDHAARTPVAVSHDHAHHGHDHEHGHDGHDHDHTHHGHDHGHRHGWFGGHHHHHHGPDAPSRGRLIGLGIAGGLVPSPSALVVLLGAVALGRTLFGATLVLAYGLGMAATLTAVGLLLVRVGDRLGAVQDGPVARAVRQLAPYSGLLTTLLVLTVGLGLVVRSLPAAL